MNRTWNRFSGAVLVDLTLENQDLVAEGEDLSVT